VSIFSKFAKAIWPLKLENEPLKLENDATFKCKPHTNAHLCVYM